MLQQSMHSLNCGVLCGLGSIWYLPYEANQYVEQLKYNYIEVGYICWWDSDARDT